MNVRNECDIYNRLGSKTEIRLLPECALVLTYGLDLRIDHRDHDSLYWGTQRGNTLARSVLGGDVYLHMYHGRDTAEENMEDWGYDGPKVRAWMVVINTDEKLPESTPDNTLAKANCVQLFKADGTVEVIPFVEDMLCFEGKFYGDFSVDCISELSDEACKHVRQ